MTSSIELLDKEYLYLLTIILSFPLRIIDLFLHAQLIKLEVLLKMLKWGRVRDGWLVWEGRDYWRLTGIHLVSRLPPASVQQVVSSSPLLSCHHRHQDPHQPHHTAFTPVIQFHFISFNFLCLQIIRRHIFLKNICVVFANWMQKVFGYIFGFWKVKINSTLLFSTLNWKNSTCRTL